jgi:hypothetical protein
VCTQQLPTGIPAKCSERGSPYAENFLFGKAGLSMNDLNNKDIVVFTVKWKYKNKGAIRSLACHPSMSAIVTGDRVLKY